MTPDQIADAKRKVAVEAERHWWITKLQALTPYGSPYLWPSGQMVIKRELDAVIAERTR